MRWITLGLQMIVSCRHWSTVARSRSRFFLTYGVCVLVSMTNIFVGDEVYSGSQTYVYKLRICKKKVGAPINLFCGERVVFFIHPRFAWTNVWQWQYHISVYSRKCQFSSTNFAGCVRMTNVDGGHICFIPSSLALSAKGSISISN